MSKILFIILLILAMVALNLLWFGMVAFVVSKIVKSVFTK